MNNKRPKVIIYACFPTSFTQKQIDTDNLMLANYCNMIQADILSWHSELADTYSQQTELLCALQRLPDTTNMELITKDLSTLSPDIERSMGIAKNINDIGGFVYFTDEESVLIECELVGLHNNDKKDQN